MPVVETKGAASAQGFGEFAKKSGPAVYIEDVFQTWLYTGNSTTGGTQTITNNIDLSTKGGMVWIKGRSAASDHILTDTVRGAGTSATASKALSSDLTSAQSLGGSSYDYLSAFSTTGFTVAQGGTTTATQGTNYNAITYGSWTFRKQQKFFDVVTWTGNGSNRTIAHNLGSVPGCIIVKRTDTTGAWAVYHRSLANTEYLVLNTTAAKATGATYWNSTTATATDFSLGTAADVNANTGTYVAYLFAHDAGGFGLTGTDNVISCGSFTTDGSGTATVSLGYEPQWILAKRTDSSASGSWIMGDIQRGLLANPDSNTNSLYANLTSAEAIGNSQLQLTSTGFNATMLQGSATYIYIAIRRGPMKTPTSGTSVYTAQINDNSTSTITTSISPVDLTINKKHYYNPATPAYTTGENQFVDRLRGGNTMFLSESTAAETTTGVIVKSFDVQSGFTVNSTGGFQDFVWSFKRAPSFLDVVCYSGTGSNTTQTHNLGVVPELIIVKRRAGGSSAAPVYSASLANTQYVLLTDNSAVVSSATTYWNSTTATSTTFSIGTATAVNASGSTYVAYLFATCAGVSKVGSYTGNGGTVNTNGTSQTIACGFTAGSRFVLIKRTDSTGNWYVFDSTRGIVAASDPYLLLNSNAAEVATVDAVDTDNGGFVVNQTSGTNLNVTNATYIFLAIA